MFKPDNNSRLAQGLAQRLVNIIDRLDNRPDDRAARQKRALLGAVRDGNGATLGAIARTLGRGAPAVSRAVDNAVKDGLIDRQQDPDNRRRLQLKLTQKGARAYDEGAADSGDLADRLGRLAQSELRAVERAMEILERLGD